MNVLVDLFRCFLIIFFAFSLKIRDNKVRGIQQQQNQYNWKKENIEGATEREWAGEEGTTTRSHTSEENGHRDLKQQSMQEPQTASGKRSSPRSQQTKPSDQASRVGHVDQDITFRNLAQNNAANSKPPGNMPNKGLPQTVKDTRGSSDVEPEKPNSSLSISIGWGSMIPKEVKKEQDDKFHRLMCIADCKMADLMVFNMKNQYGIGSESNHFLNMPLPGRPYTYNTLIDWCKENCGSSYGWMIPAQEPKPPTSTTTTTTTTTPSPTNLRASYKQEIPPFKTLNYKQPFYDFKPHLYEPSHFKPSHFPPSMWQQQPIYPTMPDHPILRFETKSPIFRPVHSALPTIFIPPMAMTKPNFFPFSNLMAGPPPPSPRSPPPPPPQMYRTRDSDDDHREIMPSMNSPGTIGMSFRLKGGPFFAGTILKRPLTGRSNMAPEYDLGVDTRQWNNGGKHQHEQSAGPFTKDSHQTTANEDKNEEEKNAAKEYEDSYQNEKDDDEDDDGEDVATTMLNIIREIYKLVTHRGVRTLLKMLFCDDDSSVNVKHGVASRIPDVGRREGSLVDT